MTRAKAKMSPTFRGVLTAAQKGEVIIPALLSYLHDPQFDHFDVRTRGFEQREPDGWFHPSTHPMWTERQLFYYLAAPQRLVVALFDPMSTLAVTAGQFWHGFIGQCLTEMGVVWDCEREFVDEDSLTRGNVDGLGEWGVFEMKTMNSMKARKIETLDDFRKTSPGYYAQGQEYMRISNRREHRTLIIGTEYPFPMKEIVMPYDRAFATETRDRYLRVIQAVADQREPKQCCAPGSKEAKGCVARLVCEVGSMR